MTSRARTNIVNNSFAAPLLILAATLAACASEADDESVDADEGALESNTVITCKPTGDPCFVDGPGQLETTCYRQWKVERVTATRGRIIEKADHGESGIAIAALPMATRAYRVGARSLSFQWGPFAPYSKIQASGSNGVWTGEVRLFDGRSLPLKCARNASDLPSGVGRGASCRHPTSDPGARCASGLECDTNGADHIEAHGRCVTRRAPSGVASGGECRHPTSDPSARCQDGLQCDTNGADHIEAEGVCR